MENTSKQNVETVQEVAAAFMKAFREEDRTSLQKLSKEAILVRVPGAENVPFTGDWQGISAVLEFAECLRKATQVQSFEVDKILADHEEALVLGRFEVQVPTTSRSYFSEYVVRIAVEDGLVKQYLVLEDSYAISLAFPK